MDIGSVNRVNTDRADLTVPSNPTPAQQNDPSMVRQIVTAIRGLNQSEMMAPDRQLTFMLDPKTQRPVIRIVEKDSGDVIDQIPPEMILLMRDSLNKGNAKGES